MSTLKSTKDRLTESVNYGEPPVTGGGGAGTPSDSVSSETSYGLPASAGTSGDYSRADHTHGSPDMPTLGDIGAAAASHTHAESDVTNLVTDLAAKITADDNARVKVSKAAVAVGTRRELNFIEGSNVTLTVSDDGGNERVDVTIAASGGGGGAPTTAEYLVAAADSTLSAERVTTNTSSVTWDHATAGQAKANVVFGTTAGTSCQGNDSRLSDSRTPTAHATSHKNGGSDELATATPAASAIPKADAGGKLDSWITDATTSAKGKVQLATDGGTTAITVVQATDSRLSNARTPTTHASSHASGGGDALSGNLDANARVAVKKAGSVIGTRRGINFIEGTNVTLTVADDSGNEEVDVTIASTGGGGGVTGTGTIGKVAKFTGATAVGDSVITESSGKIGVNQGTPGATLHATREGAGDSVYLDSYGTGTWSNVRGRSARGSISAPTQLLADDYMASYGGTGYTPSGWPSGGRASFIAIAAENQTATGQGAYIRFDTTQVGTTTPAERMRIHDDGKVSIGTVSKGQQLTVAGTIESTSGGFKFPDATTQTTAVPLASPAFTGTPTAPTATAGTNTTQIATTAFVQTAVGGVSFPAGVITAYGGSTAPSGWLLCNGSAVSRSTYSALFAAISTTYGVGDGSTTFNVPNLQQRFPLGKAASGTGSTLGGTGGAVDHTHTVDPASFRTEGTDTLAYGSDYDGALSTDYRTAHTHAIDVPSTTSSSNNPPFQVVNYIIKT